MRRLQRHRLIWLMSAFALLALALQACAPSVPPSPTAAPAKPAATSAPAPQSPTQAAAKPADKAASNAAFQQVLAAAKQEGEVIYMGLVPFRESMNQLIPAFNKRFGTDIKVTQVAVDSREIPARVIAESKQPKATADMGWGGIINTLGFRDAGVLQKFEWVETFGSELPSIKDRVEKIDPALRGTVLETFHLPYGLVYDTRVVKAEELPKTWDQMGDPKWAGRFAADPSGSGWGYLNLTLGEEKTLEIARKVKANKPVLSQSAVNTVERVIAGEAAFGLSTVDTGEAKKLQGATVDWVVMDPIAAVQSVHYVTPNAPHPNAARLFAAWMVTEGLTMLEKLEGRGQVWPGSTSSMGKKVEASKAKLSLPTSIQDLNAAADLTKKVAQVFSQ